VSTGRDRDDGCRGFSGFALRRDELARERPTCPASHHHHRGETLMKNDVANYQVIHIGGTWTIDHDGQTEGDYATKEAAFEAIIWAASLTIRDGVGVRIDVPPRKKNEPSLGSL
jgi:hypothetical protein